MFLDQKIRHKPDGTKRTPKKLNLPTNIQTKDFKGVSAQKLQKIKKKQKYKKKIKKRTQKLDGKQKLNQICLVKVARKTQSRKLRETKFLLEIDWPKR